jgi:hypothetical protein
MPTGGELVCKRARLRDFRSNRWQDRLVLARRLRQMLSSLAHNILFANPTINNTKTQNPMKYQKHPEGLVGSLRYHEKGTWSPLNAVV